MSRPQTPDIFVGLRERFCSLAIFTETEWNSLRNGEVVTASLLVPVIFFLAMVSYLAG